MNTRVVVTGVGVVSSVGTNADKFTQALRDGKSGIGFLQNAQNSAVPVRIGAEIRSFQFEALLQSLPSLPPEVVAKARQCARRAPFSVQCSVLSALEAWARAELHDRRPVPERIGVIVAGSNIGQNYQYTLNAKFQQAPEYLTPSYALHVFDTDHVATISEVLSVRGEGFTVGGASASGNVGIIKGYQLLQADVVDVCLVVGAVADLSPMELQAFYNIGATGGRAFDSEPEKACRPFDTQHEGFIYGQASACLVLEAAGFAQRREAPILAELLGGAIVLDGNRSSDPNEEGEARAMQKALQKAGEAAEAVDYINAHGTSTPAGDIAELRAIRRVFQEHTARIWINSTKGLVGHCLYSAGVVEAAATIVQLCEGFVHPNANLQEPCDTGFRFAGLSACPAGSRIALSNSFGFGGINTSIVLARGVTHE
ncbi:MAG TPA: beta-ketoacyl synthase N-terminal-like domain-containing protein [Symbiobacteriaceae bacterium]|jgi:malonyl-ACP decarboxylase